MTDARPAAPASPPPRGLVRTSVSVGGWTLVSRLTGFIRLAAIAAVLGPTFLGNLFQTANQLPNLAFELVAGQLIASLLLPALVSHLDAGDRLTSERLAGGFLGVVLVVFGLVALVLVAAAPAVSGLMGVGIDDPAVRDDLVRLGWPLLAVVMPQLVLYGFIGVANAVQNARHRFGVAAAAPVVENVVVLAALVLYRVRTGRGAELHTVRYGDVLLLGAGSTLGVALHAAVQWWGARRVGIRLRPRAGWRDPQVRAIVRLAVPSLGLAGLNATQTFACLVVVGSVPGGVVAFQLGLAFVATAVALGARPLSVAALPDLARLAVSGDQSAFRRNWDRTLALAVFLLAPVAAALSVLAPALARLLGVGAMAGGGATALLTAALVGLSVAVLGEGITSFTVQAAYARRDARSPLQAALLRTLLLTAGLGVALRLDDPAAVVLVAGASFSLATLLSAWFVCHATLGALAPHEHHAAGPSNAGRLGSSGVAGRSTGAGRAGPSRAGRSGGAGRHIGRAVALAVVAALPAAAVSTGLLTLHGPLGRALPAVAGATVLGAGYLAAGELMARRHGWPSVLRRTGQYGDSIDLRDDPIPAPAAVPSPNPGRRAAVWRGATARRWGRAAAGPAGVVVLAAAAVGPAIAMRDARWFLTALSATLVLAAAARPRDATLVMIGAGPLIAAFDLRHATIVTTVMAASVATGVLLDAAARQARGERLRSFDLPRQARCAVGAAALLALGTGLLLDVAGSGLELVVIIAAAVLAQAVGLRGHDDQRLAARLVFISALLSVPMSGLWATVESSVVPLGMLVGLGAAVASAAGGQRLVASGRRRTGPTTTMVAVAVALTAGGGWVALGPAGAVVWLAVRAGHDRGDDVAEDDHEPAPVPPMRHAVMT